MSSENNTAKQSCVFVTGVGIVSALGTGVPQNLESLLAGKSGLGSIRFLKTRLAGELIAGEVTFSDEELRELAEVQNHKGLSRVALLGLIAAGEAVKQSGSGRKGVRTGIISGTTAEALRNVEVYLKDFLTNDSRNEFIESQDWGHSTRFMAERLGINGYRTTINTACSSAANAIMTGARMIKHGLLDRVLVGGTDALGKTMLNGFHALMIVDPEACKPFDANRRGLNLGEGAAFLMLESDKMLNGKEPLCELTGYGNANDAYHLTALSPDGEGAAGAIRNALQSADLRAEDISYINAHGTGTENNDLSEALGLQKVFGESMPPFSSTKPFTGHTLGSSGALEAVFCIFALQHGLVFPNLNFREPMSEAGIRPEVRLQKGLAIRHVLSNSLGFGGNNTSLIFSKTGS